MAALALALVAMSSLSNAGAVGNVFTVNSTADGGDVNLSDGLCDDGAGHCTFRAAIEQANASAGTDTVTFSIGSGTQTITPSSALPTVTGPLIIDGTSQPGFSGSPIVELDGTNAGGDVSGLTVTAGNSTVKGLVINRFSRAAIDMVTNGGNVVVGNFLGTNVSGTVALGNEFGAQAELSSGNTIGGTSAGARNLISGNTSSGVLIEGLGVGANGNQVEGNYIGTDVSGSIVLGNAGTGVAIIGAAANNTIGGTSAGAGNLISGNMFGGIGLDALGSNAVPTGNKIQGNFIGTDSTGTAALPNTRAGIELDGASNNTIGGAVTGARNLISGNTAAGVFLSTGSSANAVQGNFIGTDVGGSAALGNGFDGVVIQDAANNTIGGTSAGAGNVISGNTGFGVELDGSGASGNQIQGNLIGTDSSGIAALGNSNSGVALGGSPNNLIGGAIAGARNVISGNKSSGISIFAFGGDATGNQVLGNFVGTDVNGKSALGNGDNGIDLSSSVDSTIGGTAPGAGNVISANARAGISIEGVTQSQPATGIQILGNFIGTDISGTVALGNGNFGLVIDGFASNNIIGGTSGGARNLISGNGGTGVLIAGSNTTGNQVQGNFIGTDVNGTGPLGNGGDGVELAFAGNNTVGGTTPGARNIISGNSVEGIAIEGFNGAGATGNQIQGNFVGTDLTGSAALGNGLSGIVINGGGSNTIGGTSAAARNLVSGNFGAGVVIVAAGGSASANQVEGNYIGTDVSGTTALRNQGDGVEVLAAGNLIGGSEAGAGNLISANGLGSGVLIRGDTASGNAVQGNFIGTNADGTAALPNEIDGVTIFGAPDNTIGGATPSARNVISGNVQDGVFIIGAAAVGNKVEGNFVGTDVTGNAALGNHKEGVVISGAVNTVIGGSVPEAGNVISGNLLAEEVAIIGGSGSQLQGNFIGTDATGSAALGNNGGGIAIVDSADNLIGGTAAGMGNVVSGSVSGVGVLITGLGATGNILEGNYIGTGAGGSGNLGNAGDGIVIGAPNNVIGGTASGEANTVAFNQGSGVEVNGAGATGDTIRGNSIYSNKTKGIANVNGGNTELPPPVITSAEFGQGGSVSGTACGTCTVDVYSDSADEGRIYEGSTGADGSGNWSFFGALSGPNVTSTATDGSGDTSEFSTPFQGGPTPSPTPSPTASSSPTATPTPTPTPTSTPTPTPTPTQTPPSLDHYQCYDVRGAKNVNQSVTLSDQFGSSGVQVHKAVEFCNPVQKTDNNGTTPITNPDGHLTFYRLAKIGGEPTRLVDISNQFGRQTLRVTSLVLLAVPTQKLPLGPPSGLDHFECYRTSSGASNATVDLQDEFVTERGVQVLRPALFCNPAQKVHGGQVFPSQHPQEHLVCYIITRTLFKTRINVVNQFESDHFKIDSPHLLCVPSLQLAVDTPTPRPDQAPTEP